MTRSYVIAIGIVAILRSGFGSALMIISTPSAFGSILNSITFACCCFYLMNIKLCPDEQFHLLITVINLCIGIIIREFVISFLTKFESIVYPMINAALADSMNTSQMVMILDMIIAAMAVYFILNVAIDEEVLQKVIEYYRKGFWMNREC